MKIGFYVAIVLCFFLVCCGGRENGLINEGNALVEKVQKFMDENGRVPVSLTEAGAEEREQGPLYYDILDSTAYIFWFGSATGESVLYDSRTGQWRKY